MAYSTVGKKIVVYTSAKSLFSLILSNEAAQIEQRISVTTVTTEVWVFGLKGLVLMLTNNYVIQIWENNLSAEKSQISSHLFSITHVP